MHSVTTENLKEEKMPKLTPITKQNKENKECFAKVFMIITAFSYNRKLKIREEEKMSKLTSMSIRNIF